MQASADSTGKLLRSSETRLVSLAPQTGLNRMWAELAVRSLGLRSDKRVPLKQTEPCWGRIAALLLEPGQSTF